MGLNSFVMGDFFFPFPFTLSWCRFCDIVTKIESKNINYLQIILTLGKAFILI